VERVRDFGNAWTGVGLWKVLELDRFFSERIEKGREEIGWEGMICFLVVSRFCEAMSELKTVESFTDQSALADILGINPLKINKDRLYRAMDQIFLHKKELGGHLKKRYGELFRLEYDLFLYDMTSTYFEGQCVNNPQAKMGYSRDHRPDCKQVTLALVVTKEGLPVYCEIFDGNRTDVTTVEDVVEAVESDYGRANRVWVMDRGMVSEDNLQWLRQRGTSYIVGTPKSMLKKFEEHLISDKEWVNVMPDIEVRNVMSPEHQDEMFILCRSSSRREKELAMSRLFVNRIENGLQKLVCAVERIKRPLKDRDIIQRKIGALLKINSRAARLFDIRVKEKDGRLHVIWEKKTNIKDWVDLSAGCYLLRTNISREMEASDLWRAYIGLTQAEEAFRITKQDIGLRPIWHHEQDRVQGHILIAFLALVLQKTFEQGLIQKGLGHSTRKVIQELKGLKSMDVILPATDGNEIKMRIVSEPDPSLKILLDRLCLKIPKRLCLYKNVVEKLKPYPLKIQSLSNILPA
jgi:transposase